MQGGKNRKIKKLGPLVNSVCHLHATQGPMRPSKSGQSLGMRPAYKDF
jgi:hypothetical protein